MKDTYFDIKVSAEAVLQMLHNQVSSGNADVLDFIDNPVSIHVDHERNLIVLRCETNDAPRTIGEAGYFPAITILESDLEK